jgi:N-methylhydantoinase B
MTEPSTAGGPRLDGVRLAVLTNRMQGIVKAMANTLFRTGRSCVLNTSRDFSNCIVTADNQLLAAAESLPIHVMCGPDMMAAHMKSRHPELRRGDAFLHNSPYHGCSHAADQCILIPVIDDDGVHRFTVVGKAHQADIGNSAPTTYFASARDLYEEGALIFPSVRVQENYEDVTDIIEMCKLRIRIPEQWWGDYLALLGAARVGERRLLELGAEVGWDTLEAYTEQWLDYSEQRMVEQIRKLPSAEFTSVGVGHDPLPEVPDGIPLEVGVKVDSEAARVEVDLRNNPDCQPCGVNLTEATARTAALIGIFNSVGQGVPPNAGSFRRVEILLRENCVVGIPRHPASCSVATTGPADRVANAIQRGMAEIGEGFGMAEVGLVIPPATGVLSGFDPRNGETFVNQVVLPSVTGGGGAPSEDGWLTAGLPAAAGMMYRDSAEIDELRFPIRIVEQRIIANSEGAGRFRGAPGAYVEYGPIDTSMDVMYASDGNVNPPLGARGGEAGARAVQYKRDTAGELTKLDPITRVTLNDGETIVSETTGGGGYGPAVERSLERVRRDVVEGWVSAERAAEVYGVVVDESGEIDEAATAKRRAALESSD